MMKSVTRVATVLCLAALPGMAAGGALPPASVTLGIENPTVTATRASFDVDVSFQGSPGDRLEAVQLSVVGSSPALTANGSDYGRFRFNPALAGWEATSFNPGGFSLVSPADPADALPPTSSILLGTLNVDLTGIAFNTPLLVTLLGGTPAEGNTTSVGALVNSTLVDSVTNPDVLRLTIEPGQASFRTVPEPASLAMATVAAVAVFGLARRARRAAA